ncbi:MAG: DUF1499 domain-containing protein [Cyanobacteria bacterium P01_F01_bin.42]
MRKLLLCLFTFVLIGISAPIAAAAPISYATLPGFGNAFAGSPPDALGVQNEQLSSCPSSPNCVASQNSDEAHAIEPISYSGSQETAKENLLKVLSVVPRTNLITEADNYIRVEFQTKLLGFIDDGEFYFPSDQSVVHVRSASRLGESDLNLNRRRIEQIRLAMADLKS